MHLTTRGMAESCIPLASLGIAATLCGTIVAAGNAVSGMYNAYRDRCERRRAHRDLVEAVRTRPLYRKKRHKRRHRRHRDSTGSAAEPAPPNEPSSRDQVE